MPLAGHIWYEGGTLNTPGIDSEWLTSWASLNSFAIQHIAKTLIQLVILVFGIQLNCK